MIHLYQSLKYNLNNPILYQLYNYDKDNYGWPFRCGDAVRGMKYYFLNIKNFSEHYQGNSVLKLISHLKPTSDKQEKIVFFDLGMDHTFALYMGGSSYSVMQSYVGKYSLFAGTWVSFDYRGCCSFLMELYSINLTRTDSRVTAETCRELFKCYPLPRQCINIRWTIWQRNNKLITFLTWLGDIMLTICAPLFVGFRCAQLIE